ncbi:PHO86 [Candida jiufengensis]|uniref:PHO86 n=1 Tax=Candida jiufengensis TaxID=497108 RepID=UPI002225B4B6|nr:PHO86 [Candida jiufengensis]KAI5953666.1 PHO86 [Candida jiufengensis]
MIEQKEIDLNKPLDADKPATLEKSTLTPALTKASLILHGDYYKQSQSNLSKFVFWHPISILVYTTLVPLVFGFVLWDYLSISENLVEFYTIASKNRNDFIFNILRGAPIVASIFASFAFIGYILGDDVGAIATNFISKNYCNSVYGFDVTEFVKEKSKAKVLKNGENTNIISYRDQPIAIITLVPDLKQSTPENFVVKITGIHVRKVFQKVDFDNLLIEWAVVRSRELYQEYLKDSKTNVKKGSILITADCYSFNKKLARALQIHGFQILDKSFELNPFEDTAKSYEKLIHKILGASLDTYGIILSTDEEDYELLKNSELLEHNLSTSTSSSKEAIAKRRR